MPKGTCQAEASSNREKFNPVALVAITDHELHLSEVTRQAGSQSVNRKSHRVYFQNFVRSNPLEAFGSF